MLLVDEELEEAIDFEIERLKLDKEKEKNSKEKSDKKLLFAVALQKNKKNESEAFTLAQEFLEKIENEEPDEEQPETYDFAMDYNFDENIKVERMAPATDQSPVSENEDEAESSSDEEEEEPEPIVNIDAEGLL